MRWGRAAGAAALGLSALLLSGAAGLSWWRGRNVSAVQRGWRVAEAHGCFGCHGPGGVTGRPDAGGTVGGVPSFLGEDLQSYARDEGEIREWILDGMPRRLRERSASEEPGEASLTPMPAWRDVLSPREVDDLVAYVKAVGGFDAPEDEKAEAGREVSERLGCFGCHGPQGRGSPPNPGSLKGYIPSWDGPDFEELAQDEAEVREWILDGRPRRLQDDRWARFFMDRQVIQMPAYRGRMTPGEVEAITHYIRWLRQERPPGPPPRAER